MDGGRCPEIVIRLSANPSIEIPVEYSRLGFDFVPPELHDGAHVEVDEHDGDEDLTGGESSNTTTPGGGDKLLAVAVKPACRDSID